MQKKILYKIKTCSKNLKKKPLTNVDDGLLLWEEKKNISNM